MHIDSTGQELPKGQYTTPSEATDRHFISFNGELEEVQRLCPPPSGFVSQAKRNVCHSVFHHAKDVRLSSKGTLTVDSRVEPGPYAFLLIHFKPIIMIHLP